MVRRGRGLWARPVVLAVIALATTAVHMQFAQAGWFYRYEAYLMALGLLTAAIALRQGGREVLRQAWSGPPWRKAVVGAVAVYVAAPILARGGLAHLQTPQLTSNVYHQQFQMGCFLADHYTGCAVAANDIGAINCCADIRCLDLWGLANLDVARCRAAGCYRTGEIRKLAEAWGVRVAMVYDEWFASCGGLPEEWTLVARWRVPRPYLLGQNTVSIYAVGPDEAAPLRENLEAFAAKLPPVVQVLWAKEAGRPAPSSSPGRPPAP
jgi:hypothetical protein